MFDRILKIALVLLLLVGPVLAAEHCHEDGDSHEMCGLCQLSLTLHGFDLSESIDIEEVTMEARYPAVISEITPDLLPIISTPTRGPPQILL